MRLVRVTGAALVGMAVLAGCSDGGQASETLPSASSSAAETSESLPALGPPDMPMPPEAREQTESGAEAFFVYYLELINRTSVEMDSRYLRQLSSGCSTCNRIADETEADAVAGYHYSGGRLEFAGTIEAIVGTSGAAESAFVLNQEALQVLDVDNNPVPNLDFPAGPSLSSGATAEWDKGLSTWVMTELTLG